jgi:hypothetical protein
MSKMNQVYGIGQALISSLPPPFFIENAPTTTQSNYEVGQIAYTGTTGAYTFYIYAGAGVWELLDISTGALDTLTGDSGTAVPTAGNIKIAGTTAQVSSVASGSTVTLSLIGPYTPATYTAHGVLVGEGATSIHATSAGSAGQLLTSGGASADPTWTTATFPATAGSTGTILRSDGTNWVASTDTWPNTVVQGDVLIATGTNVVGSLADVATGQVLMSGGVGVAPAYSGSPSVSGSVTAATGLIATTGGITATGTSNINTSGAAVTSIGTGGTGALNLGNATGNTAVTGSLTATATLTATSGAITASNGNFVGTTSGTGILLTSAQNSGAASGPVVVNGRSGRATFTSVSIAAGADLTLTITNSAITGSTTEVLIDMSGATSGAALCVKSKTASSTSLAIVVTNGTLATTSTADIQIDFLILNA